MNAIRTRRIERNEKAISGGATFEIGSTSEPKVTWGWCSLLVRGLVDEVASG